MDKLIRGEYFLKSILSTLHTILISWLNNRVIIGKGSIVYYRSRIIVINRQSRVVIGVNSKIGCSSKLNHTGMPFYSKIVVDGKDSHVTIGDNCRINGVYIHAEDKIEIGNNCVMATGVNIIDSNGHELVSTDRTSGRDKPQPIIIGNNVWIGLNAVILKGSNIGDNCVVAAGSVVKGTFPPCCLIFGNPAHVDKQFDN